MSLGLDLGLMGDDVAGGGGGSTPITGIRITISGAGFVGISDLGIIIDGTGEDIVDTLVSPDDTTKTVISSFGDLSDGEYGTDSNFDDNPRRWNDAHWDDVGGTANTVGQHFNGGGGADMNIYVKFASALTSLDKVKLASPQVGTYPISAIAFEDQDGNTLTPTNSPSLAGTEIIYEF